MNENGQPPQPLDAATVVVVRDAAPSQRPRPHRPGHGFEAAASDAGPHVEVLMLKRNSRGFFGGMWVFPGGAVDPPDRGSADSDSLDSDSLDRGSADRDSLGDMVGPCDPRTADENGELFSFDPRGFRAAAKREAREEAGIDLSDAELAHFSHWLPPPIRMKRFSTHFFVCEAPAGIGEVRVDGEEILDHAWVSPAAALARRDGGEIEFVTPTFVTLTWLSRFERAADVLESAAGQKGGHTCYHTALVAAPESDPGNVAVFVGDAAYAAGDLDAPGPRRRCWMLSSGWRWEEHDG